MTLFGKLVRENQHLPTNLYSPALPKKFIESIIINLELSLREVETLVRYLEVLQVLTDKNAFLTSDRLGYALLKILAVVIYCFKPDLANEISNSFNLIPVCINYICELCIEKVLINLDYLCTFAFTTFDHNKKDLFP